MKKLTIQINCENVYFGGNRSGKLDIRESNVLGFIRRWYESLGEETGYFKHNQNIPKKCEISFKGLSTEQEIIQKASKELCLSCFFFGTTGWAKRFWLNVKILGNNFSNCKVNVRGKTFSFRRYSGDIQIKLVFPEYLSNNDIVIEALEFLWFTLKFIEKYGYVGARNGKIYNEKGIINNQKIFSNFGFTISKLTSKKSQKSLDKLLNNLEKRYKLKIRNKKNNKSNKLIDWVR